MQFDVIVPTVLDRFIQQAVMQMLAFQFRRSVSFGMPSALR